MKSKYIIIVVFLFLVVSITTIKSETPIADCSILSESGYYSLTDNIMDSSEAACINISANDVIFDGQGNTIQGQGTYQTYGIYISRDTQEATNITILNCNLSNWYGGIYFYQSSNNTIYNNTGLTNDVGIFLSTNSNYSKVYNNNFTENDYDGFLIFDSSSNEMYNNLADGDSNSYGFYIEAYNQEIPTDNNSLYNNTAINTEIGFYIEGNGESPFVGKYNSIYNNNATNNNIGIYLDDAIYNEVYNNIIRDNADGIYLEATGNSSVYLNNVRDSSSYGIETYYAGYVGADLIYNNLFNNSVNYYGTGFYENYWNITNQVGTRIHSTGTNIGGNYWTNSTKNGYSDTCEDSDEDGFCDSYYNVTTGTSCTIGVNCGDNVDYLAYSDKYSSEPPLSSTTRGSFCSMNSHFFFTGNSRWRFFK